ncbi:MAG: hypothetical protein NC320_11725 [Clostridium sp.]|nr:hypothetical protein [Clostridium sp.]
MFATSVQANESHISTIEESDEAVTDTTITTMETDGTTYYSWDNGQTRTVLTDEEHEQLFSAQNVEWWTYNMIISEGTVASIYDGMAVEQISYTLVESGRIQIRN